MLEDIRPWIRRHLNVVLSFVIGITFGISILALAYFSTRNRIAAEAFRYGAQVTRNADLDEDMAWFICGGVVGASITSLAWWRDSKNQSAGLEKADVLNRLSADPNPPTVRRPERPRQSSGKT